MAPVTTQTRSKAQTRSKITTLLDPVGDVAYDEDTGIVSYWADVTPEQAQMLLNLNVHNRSIERGEVTKLLKAMRRGDWLPNLNSIDFNEDGHMQDGQHRIEAVAKHDVPVRLFIAENVPKAVQEVTDRGKRRTFRHTLELRTEADSKALATAVRVIYNYTRRGAADVQSFGVQPSDQELLEVLEEHPGLRLSASTIGRNRMLTKLLTPGIATGLHYLFSKTNPESAEEFFRNLAQGGLSPDENVNLLHDVLFRHLTSSARLPSRRKSAYAIKVFNASRKGRKLSLLRWGGGYKRGRPNEREKFPVIQDCPFPAGTSE